MQEYIFTAKSPKRYFTFTAPKNCQLKIVEKAKNSKQIEAGMGSTPHAHARATAKSPHEQGLMAMISVFIDTFIVLNMTVFAVL